MELNKQQKLLELMMSNYSSYPKEGWVSMDEILIKIRMSSFNQRFQEWRDRGIIIKNRMINKKSEYKLVTHPSNIDKITISCTAQQQGLFE